MLNSLHVSQSGLNAARVQVENVSNNIANENTPGYKKRVVQVSENEHINSSLTGSGVTTDSSYRIISKFMSDNISNENSKLEHYDELSTSLGNIETIFKETDNSGVSADLNRYFQAVEDLRSSPNSEVFKSNVKNQGTVLANSIKNIYDSIETQEKITKNDLENNIDKVNNILNDIGAINEKILKYSSTTNDLLDKRDNLEKELSKYVKIDVTVNDNVYELKIAGQIAIGQNTNVRDLKVSEEFTSQKDKFTIKDSNDKFVDSIKNSKDEDTGIISERGLNSQDIVSYKLENGLEVSVTVGEVVKDSLGNNVDLNEDGDLTNDTVTRENITRAIVYKINNDEKVSAVLTAYNGDYSTDSDGLKSTDNLKDNYLVLEAKKSGTDGKFDGRISITEHATLPIVINKDTLQKDEFTFKDSSNNIVDAIKSSKDKTTGVINSNTLENHNVSYKLENGLEVSVTIGEDVKDLLGNNVDLNGDGDLTNDTVTRDNITRALVYKINNDPDISGVVTAYNGAYTIDGGGLKSTDDLQDNYLVLEAKDPGTAGNFNGKISVTAIPPTVSINVPTISNKESVSISSEDSKEGIDEVYVSMYDQELSLSTGILKVQTDNLTSDSVNNKLQGYKDKLDNLAKTLSDLTDSYIKTETDEYIYGDESSDSNLGTKSSLNLFSGNSVETLSFNANNVNDLDLKDLNYLATLQWKKDISFDGEDSNSSFLEFYQEIRVDVSEDKENNDFLLKTQKDIVNSLENTYNQITKVDKDEEMLNLIKFQAAYTANAKIVTTIDEMLKTLLGLKR